MEGTQWGRPGPGGAYWRPSAVTGQGFLDSLGWVTSDDPRKRQSEVKHSEAETMKAEVRELQKKRESEYREMMSETGQFRWNEMMGLKHTLAGTELAPLLKHAVTGKPRKDPATGYMMNHSLPSTDVTRLATQGSVIHILVLIQRGTLCFSLSYKIFPFIVVVQLCFPQQNQQILSYFWSEGTNYFA